MVPAEVIHSKNAICVYGVIALRDPADVTEQGIQFGPQETGTQVI